MKDLTKGNITKLMIEYAVPILIGSIFQQLYGIIDTKVVSEKLGENALASMGAVNPVYWLIIGFAIGLTNMLSGILRALGDTKAPLVFLTISAVINIVLDYAMVVPFGIKGASWATVISQIISAIMCVVYIIVKCTHTLSLKPSTIKIII